MVVEAQAGTITHVATTAMNQMVVVAEVNAAQHQAGQAAVQAEEMAAGLHQILPLEQVTPLP